MSELESSESFPGDKKLNIHGFANVSPKAELGEGVCVGSGAVIGPDVIVGPNTWIGPNVIIDHRRRGCLFFSTTLYRTWPQTGFRNVSSTSGSRAESIGLCRPDVSK